MSAGGAELGNLCVYIKPPMCIVVQVCMFSLEHATFEETCLGLFVDAFMCSCVFACAFFWGCGPSARF
jgi:hypothetical protein